MYWIAELEKIKEQRKAARERAWKELIVQLERAMRGVGY
jgi:hypothetical protein